MAGPDVVVVGGGNAAMTAALAAREQGASVLLLERAPYAERGGNTAYTGGIVRFPFTPQDIERLVPDLSEAERASTEFGTYTQEDFFDDLARVTEHRADPDLVEALVTRGAATIAWQRDQGVRFVPSYGRQAYQVDGRFTFWGGLAVEVSGGGQGLVEFLTAACERAGVTIRYGTRARDLIVRDGRIRGVRAEHERKLVDIGCDAVVLASGGFQANAAWRAQFLGAGWDLAKVRGTRYDTGDGIRMAMAAGASPAGNWSGCHAVAWDLNAPEFGDRRIGDSYQKHSYPLGIIVNSAGRRFVDEGADFRNYTYAKYGGRVLAQPGQMAWQVFDAKITPMLRDEYSIREVTRVRADTIEDLAKRMDGMDAEAFVRTVREFNGSVDTAVPFNPNVLDGRRTNGLAVEKTNWAQPLDQPPFEAYAVTCGITFTFGGLRVDADAHVLDDGGDRIPGLYAAGELVGGLFYFNYPGGSGLTSGAVFGHTAGSGAGRHARGAR
ncbi:FAD-dependent tricarballylate dehydrogenase TcuA [Plantactinospora sp. KBS50]|uniref:FAD-dependent tricarballylate dehydrogenase TcuA n=1 Tax=Plantactinospora sp. KBS50 TaxID=2024580 RepID=UPI000BAB144C|nr:FAD-dependent tricarballylate dehydrogenase TcuA [Plantactinospora sp. KBS50]ASW57800.1 tricarballylate dehydrogenase [Plantactinospora sp. KBS50]